MPYLKRLGELLHGFELRSTGKWFFLSSAVGIVAGLGAIVFQFLGQAITYGTLVHFAGFSPAEAAGEHSFYGPATGDFSPWIVVAIMTIGGLASGFLVYTFAPEAEGHGTDAAIDSFHNKRGLIRTRIPFIKT